MGTNNYLVNVKEKKYVWFAGSRQSVHRDMELGGIYTDSVDILGMFLDAYKNVPLIHLSDDGADAHGISMEGFNQFTEDDHKQIVQEQRRLYSESQPDGFVGGWITDRYRLFPDLSSVWNTLKDLNKR